MYTNKIDNYIRRLMECLEKNIVDKKRFMGKNEDAIIAMIKDHLKNSGRRYYSEFFIGISDDAQSRLFNDHHVEKEHSWWLYITADSHETALAVKQHYINLGMRGDENSGNENSKMVYCYVVTPLTTEKIYG